MNVAMTREEAMHMEGRGHALLALADVLVYPHNHTVTTREIGRRMVIIRRPY
jgi:hypothetical protein